MSEIFPVLLILIVTLQVVLVAAVSFVLSYAGGWARVARLHRTRLRMPAGSFTCSGQFNWVATYNNLLRVGADEHGLYLRYWLRLAHAPLFLPWRVVEVEPARRVLLSQMQTLVLDGQPGGARLTLKEKTVARLLEAAGRAEPGFAEGERRPHGLTLPAGPTHVTASTAGM